MVATLIRDFFKTIGSGVPVDTYERLMAFSILKTNFHDLSNTEIYKTREDLWRDAINKYTKSDQPTTYIEFGVHKGYSIEYFSRMNNNSQSRFVGLDSFEGLPEKWGNMASGSFDVGGAIPKLDDPRARFIKGYFQNTWQELVPHLETTNELVIHYDADLYSSTLFALANMHTVHRPYIAIFDEFTGHETRALYNYLQAFGAEVQFLGQTLVRGKFPWQVLCKITP